MLNYPRKPIISDISQPTESNSSFWLWTGIAFVFLLLLEPEKKKRSQTPADLHGLEGRLRSCDAWFESTDKKGRLIHRCFIYKPTCNAKRCKADTQLSDIKNPYQEDFPFLQFKKQKNGSYKAFYSGTKDLYEIHDMPIDEEFDNPHQGYRLMLYKIKPEIELLLHKKKIIPEQSSFIEPSQVSLFGRLSGYTSTCLKFGKNRLGNRQCKKYAPTCGSADEGCRTEAAPLPSEVGKRTQKDYEMEADALSQELANEKNFELDFNKKLMRDVLSYGGIAPHKSGFMSEEYKQIPKKYKRAEGIPMDELAQEMGTDETTLADQIYQAEASFHELKDMRGGKTATRFKKTDFIDEAWNRMRSGRGFFGGIKFNPDVTQNQIRARVIQPVKIITPGVSYVMGQDGSGRVMTQSIRFDRNMYDNSQAKRWFDSNIKRIKQRDRQGYVYLKPSLSDGKTHSEDYFSPRQQEMFPGLRRELVLEQEDNASIFAVDPLDTCLERQGWDIPKIRKYQQNISAKMTPDMFGKIEKLTGAEVMLQEQIQKCLERR